ncbi:MAG: glycosyltransferase [Janthinobacterium lividum]
MEPDNAQISEIHADMGRTSVVLMLSRVEGFGLTSFEAIAACVPVIVALVSGLGLISLNERTSSLSATGAGLRRLEQ